MEMSRSVKEMVKSVIEIEEELGVDSANINIIMSGISSIKRTLQELDKKLDVEVEKEKKQKEFKEKRKKYMKEYQKMYRNKKKGQQPTSSA